MGYRIECPPKKATIAGRIDAVLRSEAEFEGPRLRHRGSYHGRGGGGAGQDVRCGAQEVGQACEGRVGGVPRGRQNGSGEEKVEVDDGALARTEERAEAGSWICSSAGSGGPGTSAAIPSFHQIKKVPYPV